MPQPKPPAKRRQGAKTPSKPKRSARSRTPAEQDVPLPPSVVEHFGEEVIALARLDVPPDAPPGAFARLLLEAMRLGMDPTRGGVYLSRGAQRDGLDARWEVLVKRDDLLAYAERHPRFLGFDSDVVHAGDGLSRIEPRGDAPTLRERAGISHTYDMLDRGPLVGAWCAVEMANEDGTRRPAVFLYARLEDYKPEGALAADDMWARHPDRCILRAAEVGPLRKGLGLNDIKGAEEMGRRLRAPEPEAVRSTGDLSDGQRAVADAFRDLHAVDPALWPNARVRAESAGRSEEELAALAERMRGDLEAALQREQDQVQAGAAVARMTLAEDLAGLRRRLAELDDFVRPKEDADGFDRSASLDAEDLVAHHEERDATAARLRALGADPDDPKASIDLPRLQQHAKGLREEYDRLRAEEDAASDDATRAEVGARRRLAAGEVQRANRYVAEAQSAAAQEREEQQ